MRELVVVRHGQTEWSASGRFTGRTDLPLTREGEEQAKELGRMLAPRSFGLVLTSPLMRAWKTGVLAGVEAVV
ncbi:MAG: histidine phosphatase family protein, partial [Acidimicrobiia bacterium]